MVLVKLPGRPTVPADGVAVPGLRGHKVGGRAGVSAPAPDKVAAVAGPSLMRSAGRAPCRQRSTRRAVPARAARTRASSSCLPWPSSVKSGNTMTLTLRSPRPWVKRPGTLDGMRAVTLPSYGGPDALVLADVPEPVAGRGGSSTLPPPR